MLKRTLIVVSVVAAVLAFGFTYVLARLRDQKEITEAQVNMERCRASGTLC